MENEPADVGFNIGFLGTSGGLPSTRRMTSATLLRFGGKSFLFDAGEGIQRQLMSTRALLQDILKIFITHLHADHIFGLPSLLLAIQQSRGKRSVQVDIYGPPGIYNFVAANLVFCRARFAFADVTIHELVGGMADPGYPPGPNDPSMQQQQQQQQQQQPYFRRQIKAPMRGQLNLLHGHYPEMSNRYLKRRQIHRGNDGVWVIETPPDPTKDSGEATDRSGRQIRKNTDSGVSKELFVMAAEVDHQDGIQTFGFSVQEQKHDRLIDPDKAQALGVSPGLKYAFLKRGLSVQSDDKQRQVHPEEVLLPKTKAERKFVLLGDNCRLSNAMLHLCQDADVLVHEATMSGGMEDEAFRRKHATASMAGAVAKRVRAKTLVLNHFSPKFNHIDINRLVSDAAKANGGTSRILASEDFMELLVPVEGF